MTDAYQTIIIFGATGDLAHRMLFPSLYNLYLDRLLPDDVQIVASGRSAMDDDGFRASIELQKTLPEDRYEPDEAAAFLSRIRYCPVSGEDAQFAALREMVGDRIDRGVAVYLSTPPSLFAPMVEGLGKAGLAGPTVRVAMEKPIGHDLASSREVNDAVNAVFDEERVFRVDHYLGKETVQNLLVLRFGNMLFEPLWSARGIEHVQITVAETVGLEGRVSYYDGVGALKDMVQNHMLQLLALVAMEAPASMTPAAVRDEKVKVIRSLRPMSPETVETLSVRGQYGSGAVGGEPVKAYAHELGHSSDTETFVALKAHIDNWRWAGVPFYLRTGKRMPERSSEILIQFRPVPHSIFAKRGKGLQPNTMLIRIQPQENIQLQVMAKQPGLDRHGLNLREVALDVSLSTEAAGQRRRIAYERLLLDLIEGDPTLFVRRDEVEAAWTWIDSINQAWTQASLPARPYTAGTWGPSAAIALIERDGASWHE
ncbi:glucose-6-phosphate dehydrogenase [Sphingomonas sp. MAH-20]|uniref:Glucose-6-phosphate 1-dehydrogenase n=1 Tax=Sphingomonas horti TaxID=2682842 RepID=A0A6I4IZ36_9SPHN|nr:glucose-6-phosphate dehydrogenase [Sphingomonas sp. CGMCC 1.13658]MBA2918555.1 glucose-6-phosphate dehydrogenase [Sphingomonas sp. CGMCC 1.13658]MVO77522.1 glucose-6-phosphate dehydrogenase [Sphingomonas horti]